MKIVSVVVYGSSVKKDYKIYERVEEIEEHNIKVVDLEDAEPGDYVKSDNGYYVPLLYKTIKKHAKNREYAYCKYKFPRYSWHRIKNLKEGYYFNKTFSYPTEPQYNPGRFMSSQSKLAANLMGQGVPTRKAIRVAYPNLRGGEIESKAKRLMDNQGFIKYLIGKTDVKKLLTALEEEGLSYNFLAKNLKEKIEKDNDLESIRFGFNLTTTAEEASKLEENKTPNKNDLSKIDFGKNLLDKKKKELGH